MKEEETKGIVDRVGRALLSPLLPRLLLTQKEGSTEYRCCFCGQCPTEIYIFTRRQIYVCPHCADVVDAIMETNHKPID